MKIRAILLSAVLVPGAVCGAPKTVMLDVQGMTCPVCPLTVKKALERVPGVQRVVVDYSARTATVEFDDANLPTDKLTGATAAAGFPSTLKEDEK